MVGLNSDASVKRLKGATRPVQSEAARAIVMAGLAFVDAVVLFDEDTPLELIGRVRPDVLVKGADYRIDQVVGTRTCRIVRWEGGLGRIATGFIHHIDHRPDEGRGAKRVSQRGPPALIADEREQDGFEA